MTSVLVLEDSPEEVSRLNDIVRDALAPLDVRVDVYGAVQTAMLAVCERQYDVALVDIQVPMHDGDEPRRDGGVKFLDFIATSRRAKRPAYVLGLTGDRRALEEATPKFRDLLFMLIERTTDSDAWKDQLARFFSYIETRSDVDSINHVVSEVGPVALAVICAIAESELKAVTTRPGVEWSPLAIPNDPGQYYIGKIRALSREHTILATAAHEQGMAAAAISTTRVIERFRPRVVAMTGVAAGIVEDLSFGDILVAERTWDYTTGKISTDASGGCDHQPELRGIPCDPMVREQLRCVTMDQAFLDGVRRQWSGQVPSAALKAKLGPIASGGAVIEHKTVVAEIHNRERKTIGVDMEAHGVAMAAWYARTPPISFVIAKSVVDFAVPPKTSEWHQYAAYTSASFVLEWARRFL